MGVVSYILYGFEKEDLANDWEKIKDVIPWSDIHVINGKTFVGPAISEIEGESFKDNVDVGFSTLAYLRRILQEAVVKSTGVYIPDSIFKVIHMTVKETK